MFTEFKNALKRDGALHAVRTGLIGEGAVFATPRGLQKIVYADYTASGRALKQVEEFISSNVLPFYANTHTESSYTGGYTTRLREAAREVIAKEVNAGTACKVIFTGSGATAAINRFVALTGLDRMAREATCARSIGAVLMGRKRPSRPLVLIGPYEHHSNILPWRESGAKVIEIAEAPDGGPDLRQLERELKRAGERPLIVGAFSAASNVTGILTDVVGVTRLLKAHGALACWDYASAGPYEPIDMAPAAGAEKDAVFVSPHKFAGGPAASGILVVREAAVTANRPTWPGGGTVMYVSPWNTDYAKNLCDREEAGTPNVIGDIRAALAFQVKAAVGVEEIARRDAILVNRALDAWASVPNLKVLSGKHQNRLPIFSFVINDRNGQPVHHALITRLLSDRFGIQARSGCACAGPYGHRLLELTREKAEAIRNAIHRGDEMQRPGWTRLNLSYLMEDTTVDYIIAAVAVVAREYAEMAVEYEADAASAQFHPRGHSAGLATV